MATAEWGSDWDAAAIDGNPEAGDVNARERHKLAERERRKSMRELFLSLHAILPHANTVRKEQSAILDEIINYIPIAVARLQALKKRKNSFSPSASSMTKPTVRISNRNSASSNSTDCIIRLVPEPSSSVAVRLRGDRVNVSLTDIKCDGQTFLLSAFLDELEAHHLEPVRSTHCRDGSKILTHSESKIPDGLERSPALLKERLQELACKLQKLRSNVSLKRSFDQIS
ncbi:PREDICTED: uncharacterized protein LOC104589958 [Nelumbo nucifera]|uniref:Uncharacterized protein LOC104589958 n=2 Tax=Nelumbo nucifera TaxID=4432 RepID=A0A1U7ZGP5_NELNU|nr:PREDICTED: uncharacterized protein LOC104589958 [Nelumbo nucifera]DAD42427.1 TPA_asm: hypothetical protein HUJ06_000657 [Nelumbo nucifera]